RSTRFVEEVALGRNRTPTFRDLCACTRASAPVVHRRALFSCDCAGSTDLGVGHAVRDETIVLRPGSDQRHVGAAHHQPLREQLWRRSYARRLMLALALLTPHPVLLMDEPFDGFDIRQTREIMALMRRVAAHGRTFTLAIHQLADAERVCDRFILLTDGRVCGIGSLDDLRTRTGQTTASLEDVFLALT